MKPKKKAGGAVKKPPKKAPPTKPTIFVDKTIVTTKQKTHTTLQDHFEIVELKKTVRANKSITPREEDRQKFKQYNLSPFSNGTGPSCSPQIRKNISPRFNQNRDKKKHKAKNACLPQKGGQKRKIQVVKKQGKQRKMTKEEYSHQEAYQNLLLQKMDQKKITQLSEESSLSIPKFSKLQINYATALQVKPVLKNNCQSIRQMRDKIHRKYRKELPGLKKKELAFLCSVVLIQRLWRQSKTKKIISDFLYHSPRSHIDPKISAQSQRDCKLDLTSNTLQHTSELIKKYNNASLSSERKMHMVCEVNSTEMESNRKRQAVCLKDLELSSQLSPQKQANMIRFVECIRDISFFKPTKATKTGKMNVFNLQSSLSEKCVMQKLYAKVFKDSPTKKNNFEIFSLKKEERQLQRSIQLINTMKSPQKVQVIQFAQRFQTQIHQPEHHKATAEVSVSTEPFQTQDKQEVNTLKQLNLIADEIINMLQSEFSQEFYGFTTRTILKKKKKARLPGLKVTSTNIRQYLDGLVSYMLKQYEQEVVRRFKLTNPLSFLKIHHEYDDEDQYIEDEDDQQFNMPIVPNTLFYQYQLIYEEKVFTIAEQDKKYSNFIEGLIKIHNLLLANCISELMEKTRMDRIVLPWDNKFQPQRTRKKLYSKVELQKDLSRMIESVCSAAFMRVGQFHRSIQDSEQQRKMLKSINQQYKSQGNDWSAQYQYLEMRLELAKHAQQYLLTEIINDLKIFL